MIQRTLARKAGRMARKGIAPGGCFPPYLQPNVVRKMLERKLTPAGASFKIDSLALTRTRQPGVWSFQGNATRRPFYGPHKMPLGGQRLEIRGVFDAVKQELLRYTEKVQALLRGLPKK